MIHKSSVIDPKAIIEKNVKIGPFCFVGPNVELKEGVELMSNVHIKVIQKLEVYKTLSFTSIGTSPQDLKYKDEHNSLDIGEYNTVET